MQIRRGVWSFATYFVLKPTKKKSSKFGFEKQRVVHAQFISDAMMQMHLKLRLTKQATG